MKKTLIIAFTIIAITAIMFFVNSCSQSNNSSENSSDEDGELSMEEVLETEPTVSEALGQWRAGQTVTEQDIELFGGVDKCFSVATIPDSIWQLMQGKSYQENPYIQRSDLRHIKALHWDKDQQIHIGEMVLNKLIADKVAIILRQLYDAKYPIQRMVLPDLYEDDEAQMRDNNSSGFCYRTVAHSGKLSKHARGLAVDINTLYNPYYKDRSDGTRFIQPSTAEEYCDRTKEFPYKIDHNDLCYKLFREAGFRWGGDFRSCKDYQHFEFVEVGSGATNNTTLSDSESIEEDDSDDSSEEMTEDKGNDESGPNTIPDLHETGNEITTEGVN